jgi:hypothetical protein
MSIISSQSSTTISSSDPISFESFSLNGSTALVSSFDYGSIGDEQQHKRGKELNAIVHEFLKVQLGYVDLLQKIGEVRNLCKFF